VGILHSEKQQSKATMPDEPATTSTTTADKLSEADIFFMLSRELLTIADFSGYFKRLNPFWQKVLGYSLEELYAKPFLEFVHPDDRNATMAQMEILSRGSDVIDFENRYIAKDGGERWFLWSAHASEEDGLIYAIAHDITERKMTETELLNNSAALENAVEGIAKVDSYGRFMFVNARYAEHLGYKPEELLGAHWHISVHPDDVPELQRAYDSMLVEGKSEIEARGITRDGNLSHSQIVLVKALDQKQRFIGHHCFMKDITARKQAEASLKKTESKLTNLLRHVPGILYQFVLHKDETFSFPYMSESCRNILGYEPSDFQNDSKLALSCIHEDDIEPIRVALAKSAKELTPFNFELRCFTKASELRWALLSSTPERLADGDILWNGLLTDITELKMAEAKIKQLNEDLAQRISVLAAVNQELEILTHKLEIAYDEALEASKLKSEFVANISHEVRTPISAVIGMSELLMDSQLTGEQRQFVNIVSDSAQSLLTIINDILDFSKMEAGRIELEIIDFNLISIVNGCADWLESAAKGKNLRLMTNIDPKLPPYVKGDPVRLRQVLLNLASNAIKFTAKGTVILTAELMEQRGDALRVRFEVSDTGIGLSESSKKRLFQPFSQADGSTTRKYGGTGLGLSISKRLVELMGGDIDVDSEEGVGSKFWFTLPFQTSESKDAQEELELAKARAAYEHEPQAALSLSGQHEILTAEHQEGLLANNGEQKVEGSDRWVLLAEDNQVLQDLACRQLNKLGFNVKIVSNGIDALDAASDREYSLILMDCQMPEMDGFEATLEIRKSEATTGKHVLIVALTASAMPSDREKCLESGMDDYLSKPVRLQQLCEIIKKWLPLPQDGAELTTNQLAFLDSSMNRSSNNGANLSSIDDEALTDGEEVIDLKSLKQFYGEDSVEEILRMFLDEAKELFDKIADNLKNQDRKQLIAAAHQLKGVTAAVHTPVMNNFSLELERAARDGSWQSIEDWHEKLLGQFARVTKFVETSLNKQST
jgi:PAS domain S-box-containing protein